MKLVCPSCESAFLVDADAIGPTGRKVRCGQCGNSWLAMPVETIPDEPPCPSWDEVADDQDQAAASLADPADAADQASEGLPTLPGFDLSRRRSRAARRAPASRRKRRGLLVGWSLFALCTAALVAGVVLGRQQVIAWAPETELLYALVGLAEDMPIPPMPAVQLRLEGVTSGRRQVNGTAELVIEGKIFNPTDQPQDVPPLVATLMDPTGIELKRWVFAADSEVLPPGGRIAFQTSTENPPGKGNLNLNFVPPQP